MAHAPFSQEAAPFATVGQTRHDAPHALALVSGTHWPLQRWNPVRQVMPHCPLVQVAKLFAPAPHGVHDAPQLSVLESGTHRPLQRWNPARQTIPHWPLVQVAVPFASDGQTAHAAPQLAVLSTTQRPPHGWAPLLHSHRWVAMSHLPGCGHWLSAAQPSRHAPFKRSQ
ncbi:MAG: hypothetical protein HYY84_18965 [Deltaproteobacteria bacterium]|nr:hypothetical protein [Deltaproteobacteria bacterium]